MQLIQHLLTQELTDLNFKVGTHTRGQDPATCPLKNLHKGTGPTDSSHEAF